MEIVKPNADLFLLPKGTRTANYAEYQREYGTLPSLVTPDGKVISQWKPDATELRLLNEGAPLTLVLYTFNQPLQPIILAVGGLDLT